MTIISVTGTMSFISVEHLILLTWYMLTQQIHDMQYQP